MNRYDYMRHNNLLKENTILIKGAGEKASAVAHRLYRCGFRKIVMTDLDMPLAERRGVSFCEAIIDGQKEVCEVMAQSAGHSIEMINQIWAEEKIPVLADPGTRALRLIKPDIFIDAVMAKGNTGTRIEDAPLVIALGPGFMASKDAHFVVETNPESNYLGRLITNGKAEKDSGVPCLIAGLTTERLIRSPEDGSVRLQREIGDKVKKSEVIAYVNSSALEAPISGFIWGIVRNGVTVRAGQKIGDIDPRGEKRFCFEISAHARAIAGGVLEAIHKFYASRKGGIES